MLIRAINLRVLMQVVIDDDDDDDNADNISDSRSSSCDIRR
jgi:hypothetical protein